METTASVAPNTQLRPAEELGETEGKPGTGKPGTDERTAPLS